MRVELQPEAVAQVHERQQWWDANRPAAVGAFANELAVALRDLAERPTALPVLLVREGVEIRRWLLPKTRCHLYYAVDASRGVVDVLAVWGAQMGRLPPLAKAR